jgi:DNA (cytosine-5)-methyltransferase 1
MLHLDKGEGMRYLTRELERLDMRWAYRVVDSRAFGLPQRRQRVVLLASSEADPGPLLFEEDAGEPIQPEDYLPLANGFYWTEGLTGLGWAVDATPTLKGGSALGIASPPGIWMPDGLVGSPRIRDAERLQGFDADWTLPGVEGETKQGPRWKMVGNAVSVPMAEWVGGRLADEPTHVAYPSEPLLEKARWPRAAEGGPGRPASRVDVSMWPVRLERPHLAEFLTESLSPLSVRACDGFLSRARRSTLHFPEGLLGAVQAHRDKLAPPESEAAA